MKTTIPEPTHAEVTSLQANLDDLKINVLPPLYTDRERIDWVGEFAAIVRPERDDEGSLPVWRVRDPAGELMGEGESWREAVDSARKK